MYPFNSQSYLFARIIEIRANKVERDARGKDWMLQRFIEGGA
jgi:hypothetical protein